MRADHTQHEICLFGHFGGNNFGNESTLQALLYHLRDVLPDAQVTCICTYPDGVAQTYNVRAIPISEASPPSGQPHSFIGKLSRTLCIGIPREAKRWLRALASLRGSSMLIIPGTGLLTDAYGLLSWGPYSVFKWAVAAKLCRCRLLFVSVGAGPIYSRLARTLVRIALSIANFRSYRDYSTLQYVKRMGLRATDDPVYPDLAFSLPEAVMPHDTAAKRERKIVGLGVMEYAGRYGDANPNEVAYEAYLEALVAFTEWLLAHDYDVRLLIGDLVDRSVVQEFKCLLQQRLAVYDASRIIDESVSSVGELLSQIASTDFVVATRFHNVLFAMLLIKPVISISFHHKCASLMQQMGLPEYSVDFSGIKASSLIDCFRSLVENAAALRLVMTGKIQEYRQALDEQYGVLFREWLPEVTADETGQRSAIKAQLEDHVTGAR